MILAQTIAEPLYLNVVELFNISTGDHLELEDQEDWEMHKKHNY